MPFELVRADGGWKIRDDSGKFYSEEVMPRRQALAQMRALYANGADKKEVPASTPTGVNAGGPGGLTGVLGLTWLVGRKKVVKETPVKPAAPPAASSKPAAKKPADPLAVIRAERDRVVKLYNAMVGSNPGNKKAVTGLRDRIAQLDARIKTLGETKEFIPGSSFTVFKDAKGDYRWVLMSSNAFKDKDDEIVSTKALEDDVERSEKEDDGNFGPIRWWHVPGADLGQCDWRMVHGRTLLESGTFKSAEIGRSIKKAAPNLQVSIGFNHPPDEPDSNGVFKNIRVFERSLLPSGRAANPFTSVMVMKGDEPMATKAEKLAALKALGVDPEAILESAAASEKELIAQGVAFKEETEKAGKKKKFPFPPPAKDEDEDEEVDVEEEEEEVKAEDADEEEFEDEDEKAEDEDDEEDIPVIGNMSVKEYGDMIAKSVKEAIKGALEEALAPIAEKMHSHDSKELPAKETPAQMAQKKKEADERVALKEAMNAQQAALVQAQKEMKRLSARLAELEGETPRALKGMRASQADETVIDEVELAKMKEQGDLPSTDPLVTDFLGGFLGFTGVK